MLTHRQHEAHSFICEQISRTGVAPSFAELQSYLGVSSKSVVHAIMCKLEDRGYVRRLKHRARAVEVLKKPGGGKTISAMVAASGLVSAADAVVNHGAEIGCLRGALSIYRKSYGPAR